MSVASEEDVLAALILRWLMLNGDLHDVREEDFGVPLGIGWIAYDLCDRGPDWRRPVESAIAASERRLAVESCEREVLDAVEEWDGSISTATAEVNLRRANAKLRRARMVLTHAR